MTTKNLLGGAIINYGDTLPADATVPDGTVFFKTGTSSGIYLYSFLQDTDTVTFGDQMSQQWTQIVSYGTGVDAATLGGHLPSYFQVASTELSGLASLASNGILVRTATGAYTTRAITGSTTIAVTNGDGVAGAPVIAVTESGIGINNLSGTLGVSKGGTGNTATPSLGTVAYGTGTAISYTSVGTTGYLLKSNAGAAPTWVDPGTLSVAFATNATSASSANFATSAGSATTAGSAGQLSTAHNINGVSFNGTADITISAATPNAVTFTNDGSGVVAGTSFNGSAAHTISYNTIGAPSTTGAGASGTNWGISITGSAASAGHADTLTTARNINGVSFNGSADITVADATKLPLAGGTLTGALTVGDASNVVSLTVGAASTGKVVIQPSASSAQQIEFFGTNGIQQGSMGADLTAQSGTTNTGRILILANTLKVDGPSSGIDGNVFATGNVTAYSDRRLKENIYTIENALTKVQALNGVTFTRKGSGQAGTGLIAQDVAAVLPQAVMSDEEGYLTVAYGNIVGLLVEAIKAQQEQIEELKAQIKG